MQFLLAVGSEPPLVAGVPAALRTIALLRAIPCVSRILLLAQDIRTLRRWGYALEGVEVLACRPDRLPLSLAEGLTAQPLIVLSEAGMPLSPALDAWIRANGSARPLAWTWEGAPVAALYPDPGVLPARLSASASSAAQTLATALAPESGERRPLSQGAWQPLRDGPQRRQAEERIFESLRRPSDGYLARWDRSLSIALSKRLIKTPITPNQLTTLGLLLGLTGAGLVAFAGYAWRVLGALILCATCVLDGCDGEVARLKLLCSEAGARFDVVADNVVHAALFAAIVIGLARLKPDADWRLPGALMISGAFASMLAVWLLILRRPSGPATQAQRVYERVASRDFIYLVLPLVALRRTEWFVWGAAVGSHLFWLSLCALSLPGILRREA